jgi:hypothetical protein
LLCRVGGLAKREWFVLKKVQRLKELEVFG